MRLVRGQLVRRDLRGGDSTRPLPIGEVVKCGEGRGVGGDDEAALGLELEAGSGDRLDVLGHLRPEREREQREVELRAGFLVGDEEVPLAGTGRPAGDVTPVEYDDTQAARATAAPTTPAPTTATSGEEFTSVVHHTLPFGQKGQERLVPG